MVEEDEPSRYKVLLTPQFLEDLEACIAYVENTLRSPLAAKKMYETVREKVFNLCIAPQAAVCIVNKVTGGIRYKISYNNYNIYYRIEGKAVIVLGIKHQLQND